jgi:hypothetical protein
MSEVNAEFIVAAPPVPATVQTPPAPPAAPAQPPAPAAPAAPAQPPADPPAADDPPITFNDPPAPAPTPPSQEVVVYEKTGDPGLDLALKFVGERGFKPDHPAMQAATQGDFTALDAELKKLGDKASGYEDYLTLAKSAYETRQTKVKEAEAKTAKAVYEAVGGPKQWAAIQAWAQANADPEEKAQLNAAFKAGGLVATAAAKELAAMYQRYGKTQPKSAVKPDAASAQAPGEGSLSPREFAREVIALKGKLGNRPVEESAEYAALVRRRQSYRG